MKSGFEQAYLLLRTSFNLCVIFWHSFAGEIILIFSFLEGHVLFQRKALIGHLYILLLLLFIHLIVNE